MSDVLAKKIAGDRAWDISEVTHPSGSSVKLVRGDVTQLRCLLVDGLTGETEWEGVARVLADFCGLEWPRADENGDY